MSHPLRDYARAVQDELSRDADLLQPIRYTWALRQVETYYEHAKALAALDGGAKAVGFREFKAAVIVHLARIARTLAKRAT